MNKLNGVNDLINIKNKIELARNGKSNINKLNEILQKMDSQKYIFLINRLNLQIEIVKKYNPPIRPALDPYISSELGVYNGLCEIEDNAKLMNYPSCCVKSFEEARFGIDKEHLKEAEIIKNEIINNVNSGKYSLRDKCAIIMPSGFIPCSLNCKNAKNNNLIKIVSYEELCKILDLEEELKNKLIHYHGAYDEYYEKILFIEWYLYICIHK